MSTLTPCPVPLGQAISVAKVEELLRDLPQDGTQREIQLDLSQCRVLPAGSAWRLGNAMSRWAGSGRVLVTVPEPGDFSGDWFRKFTRSGFGLAMARFAAEIRLVDGTDVRARVRDYYEGPGLQSAIANYATAVDLPETSLVESLDAFAEDLEPMTRGVGIEPGSLTRDSWKALLQMSFEAIENVVDHAFRSPYDRTGEESLSYMSLAFYKTIDANQAPSVEFENYLAALADRLPSDRERRGFVELVVVDTGAGIAARQSQDPDIYTSSRETELQATQDALALGGTVKLRAGDSFVRGEPGYGYGYIREGLRELLAYGILRTGRCLMTLDAAAAEAGTWHVADEELGQMPGTALHIIFPLVSAQLHLLP